MTKRQRGMTKTKMERWLKEGQGQDMGVVVKPWLFVQDVTSASRLKSEMGIKSARQYLGPSFSDHALDRMGEREITIDQVYDCAMYGSVVETQDHGEDIKVVFQEPTNVAPGFYVVIADSSPFPKVITICLTQDEAWEPRNGILRRRS